MGDGIGNADRRITDRRSSRSLDNAGVADVGAHAFVSDEIEKLILDDRCAESDAELIEAEWFLGIRGSIEEVARIHGAVAAKIINGAVILI